MIRWHGSSRRRSWRASPARLLSSWPRRLALLVVAVGLVLMHHVVGAHQHSGPDAPHSVSIPGHDVAGAEAPGASSTGDHVLARDGDPGSATASPVALLHHHPDQDGHDHLGSLLHMCLAALVGAVAFLLLLFVFASWWRSSHDRHAGETAAATTVPRAPPTLTRLAELQILRL